MDKSSVTLWVDTDNNSLLTGFNTNALANQPTFKQGDNFQIDIHFLKRGANSSVELPTAGSSYKLAIGNPDARPTSGTWVLAYGSSQVEFDYNETSTSVETSLNLIPEIIAEGGVTVALVNGNTTYRITFNNKVGLSSAFTTDASNLIPSSYATVSQIKTGSLTSRGVWHIKLRQIPVAYQSAWTHSTAPVITVTALDSNTSRVEIAPAPKGGTFAVSGVFTGGASGVWKSKPIPVEATEQMVIDAIGLPSNTVLVSKSGLYSWDITILEFTSNSNLLQYVTDDGDASGIIGYDFVSGEISLNNYEVSSLLLGASYVDTVLEVEVTTGSTVSTVLQTTCRIVAEVIGQGTYSPIPFDNPISQADLDSTLLNFVSKDGGELNPFAELTLDSGTSHNEVGGWGLAVTSVSLANQTVINHDVVSITSDFGNNQMAISAEAIFFPDGTIQTSATPAVDLTDLVSKSATADQTIHSNLITEDNKSFQAVAAQPYGISYTGTVSGQYISSVYSNPSYGTWSDRSIHKTVINNDTITIDRQLVAMRPDLFPTGGNADYNAVNISHTFNRNGEPNTPHISLLQRTQTDLEADGITPIFDEKELLIRPTGITYSDGTTQTTIGYPRYGNPENYQTYYDVVNNYYPLHSNPNGYLHIGDDSTVPAGGLAGQVLTKATNDNYVLAWANMPNLASYATLSGATFTGTVYAPTLRNLLNTDLVIDSYNDTGAGTHYLHKFTPFDGKFVLAPNGGGLTFPDGTTQVTAATTPNLTGYAQLSGATFTGKVTTTATTASAGLNLGFTSTAPTTPVQGDIWMASNTDTLRYRSALTNTTFDLATRNATNTFVQPQIINSPSTATLPALRINNLATATTAHSLLVEDDTNPDTTAFIINNAGNIGIGVPTGWTATEKFELNGSIKFTADSSVQTTAYIPSAVAITGGSINGITIDGGTY
jgi:hypothetical protein